MNALQKAIAQRKKSYKNKNWKWWKFYSARVKKLKQAAPVQVAIAKRFGMKNCLTIVQEAKRAGLPVALAFALIEQESGNGSNVFGHDPTIFAGAGTVTRSKYLAYKRARGRTHMQGVGPAQLTWWELQDEADRKGGCWRPRYNMRVAFEHLHDLMRAHGKWAGIRAYNGTGVAATNYANSVSARERKWAARFK